MNKNDERISESIFKDAARQYELESLGRESLARRITRLSIFLWLLSLALPGFWAGGEPQYGFYILLIGIPLGWLGGMAAPYANVFYLYALVSLRKDEVPVKSLVLMMALAGTTLFVRRILVNEGGGTASITSWGWGAMLWGISLLLLVVATLVRECKLSSRGAIWIFCLIGVSLLAIAVLNRYQWSKANAHDRQALLSPTMAFSTVKLCGVPITEVPHALVPKGQLVSLDPSVGEFLRRTEPLLSRFERDGYEWVYRGHTPDFEIGRKLEDVRGTSRYLLRAIPAGIGVSIQLVEESSGRLLYEQRVLNGPGRDGRNCPDAYGNKGYIQAIQRATGQDELGTSFVGSPVGEEGRVACDAEYRMPQRADGRRPVKYCSGRYLAVWHQVPPPREDGEHIKLRVLILDRATLTLVDYFERDFKCPSEECALARTNEFLGFRFDESWVHLLMRSGELVTNREFRVN